MTTPAAEKPLTIAIAGASGYVGQALIKGLSNHHTILALSRRKVEGSGVIARPCDLYSLKQVEEALVGADVAVYLVHSMIPKGGLTQANFADLDLILADNFARAAKKNGIKRIIYLGGILPDTPTLSEHLRSRLEVEQVLKAHGAAVTALRAGLIVGRNGSSFLIVQRLVERLPAMILPAWTRSRTQPIALRDVLKLLEEVIVNPTHAGEMYEIAGPDRMTYRDMISSVADELGKRSPLVDVPWFSPKLSTLWVTLVSGQSYSLIAPLVESLSHEMLPHDRRLMQGLGMNGTPFEEALKIALAPEAPKPEPSLRTGPQSSMFGQPPAEKAQHPRGSSSRLVRSVQRLPLPQGSDANDVAKAYLNWLPNTLGPFLKVVTKASTVSFATPWFKFPLLSLTYSEERSTSDRALFYVTGGLLWKKSQRAARLEFRTSPTNGWVLAAIHDFEPQLPWFVYRLSQANAHLWVMRAFGAYLKKQQNQSSNEVQASSTKSESA